MINAGNHPSRNGLEKLGITSAAESRWNLTPDELHNIAVANEEGVASNSGALVVRTGQCTGRRPKDRFIVDEPTCREHVDWGSVNLKMSETTFDNLHAKVLAHFNGKTIYVRDTHAGADPSCRLNVRFVTETAWHNLFVAQLLIKPEPATLEDFAPDFTVLCAPTCLADPKTDGTPSEVFVVINFAKKLVLIGGTQYAGENKKSIFSIMNYLLPLRDIMTMHCSANVGAAGDVALFFGLSGTGKTTLSADPARRLIGDDEHGWNNQGIFNFEGGCYAKCINLSEEAEPQIYNALKRGAVLENVVINDAGQLDFDSDKYTENTRAAYPLDNIDNAVIPSVAGHPSNIIFLTCDAFGVLPPISKLTTEQAMYHFLSGYTAKVAGTEAGVTEPQATFSACFGAPFMPLPPSTYATMLGQKLEQHNATCWLVNTGWSGGEYGVGKRMKLAHTRAMISAALDGSLKDVSFEPDPVFQCLVPTTCPNVPSEVLSPKKTWADPDAYDLKASALATMFADNAKRNFADASALILDAGPRI